MHDNVVIKQRVNAPVDKVWKAITDNSLMKDWYFDIADFSTDLNSEFSFYGKTISISIMVKFWR